MQMALRSLNIHDWPDVSAKHACWHCTSKQPTYVQGEVDRGRCAGECWLRRRAVASLKLLKCLADLLKVVCIAASVELQHDLGRHIPKLLSVEMAAQRFDQLQQLCALPLVSAAPCDCRRVPGILASHILAARIPKGNCLALLRMAVTSTSLATLRSSGVPRS